MEELKEHAFYEVEDGIRYYRPASPVLDKPPVLIVTAMARELTESRVRALLAEERESD